MKFRLFYRALSIMLLVLFACSSYAQSPVKATVSPVEYSAEEAIIALQFEIPVGWKVYANTPGDSGIPVQIVFDKKENLRDFTVDWPEYKVDITEVANQRFVTNVYVGDIIIPIHLYPENSRSPISIKGKVVFGACDQICVREEKEFDLTIEKFFLDKKLTNKINNIEEQSESLLLFLLFAFIGGFILNLMPCVLPVLALKVLGILKYSGQSKEKSSDNLLATASGIITSFILLAGITVLLRGLGIEFGWGFQFQEPWFLVFLVVILILFAGSLWGAYELNLPQFMNDYIQEKTSGRTDIKDSFLAGAFATLLATPCTAPFLSVSVAFALTQGWVMILMIYLFLGLGMSSPYIILAFKPEYLRFLPKPGNWMVYLKKFFGLLLLGTALWLLYILSFQISVRALSLFIGFLILLKFTLSNTGFITNQYIKAGVVILISVLTLLTPIFINQQDRMPDKSWHEFSEYKLQDALVNGEIVLVDVTAEWCLICKTNKLLVLDQDDIIKFLNDNKVLLLRADFTNRSEAIAKYLESKNRYGIPLNVVYGVKAPNGIVLPELLTKNDLIQAVQKAK